MSDLNPILFRSPDEDEFLALCDSLGCIVCRERPGIYTGIWRPARDMQDRVAAQTIVMGFPPPQSDQPRYIVWVVCEECWNRLGGLDALIDFVKKAFYGDIEPHGQSAEGSENQAG